MRCAHNEQSTVVLRQDFILDYLRIPLFAFSLIWRQILRALDLVPIAGRTSHDETDLMFTAMFQVCFAYSLIKPAIHWRHGWYRCNHVAPRYLYLISRDVVACNVTIYGWLIQGVTELYHYVIHAIRELGRSYQ